jgi:uncharacterized protein (TIGR02594 family)
MGSAKVRQLQEALKSLGFNPGEIDGIWGRSTIAAVRRFQERAGVEIDGVVGPETWKALFGAPALQPHVESAMPFVWYEEARSLVGTREIPGQASNPDIIEWARDLDIDYANDDIPWCGLFVAHCIGATLPGEYLPANPLLARNWKRFGERCDPVRGAVLVFWRGDPNGSKGHVGFYHAEDDRAYHVLGGNQSNAVNLARLPKRRLIDARWPSTARGMRGNIVRGAPDGPLSASDREA